MSHPNHAHETAYEDLVKGFSVEHKPRSLVVVTGEIPFHELEAHEDHVLEHLGEGVELKGFRKGHVPANILKKHIGEMTLLSETAEHVLSEIYPHILKAHKLDAIGRPRINVTKLAPGNPFGFTLEITVLPRVALPDYKALAKGVNQKKGEATVTDEEVTAAIERVQRQKLAYDRIQEKAKQKQVAEDTDPLRQPADGGDGLTLPTPETVPKKEGGTEADAENAPLPALTDEYVKTLGAFETVEAFKLQVREHLTREKMDDAISKHRAELTDAILDKTEIDIPELLIESELNQMFGQMEQDLTHAGLTIDGYLAHVKKTREDMVKEWTPSAEKRAKTQLILNEISTNEKIEPKAEDIEREVASLLAHYKDADKSRVRIYIESVLRNNEVMKFLESQ